MISKNVKINTSNHLLGYIDLLNEKGYSIPTINAYRAHLQRFLNYLKEKELYVINQREVRNYLLFLINEKHYSTSAQNNVINALKIFFSEYLNIEIDDNNFPRPRKEKKLPKTLSKNEVKTIFNCTKDIRIKCMIYFVYSAGLSPSEISYLKITDIDSKQMRVFISSPKDSSRRLSNNGKTKSNNFVNDDKTNLVENGRYVFLSNKVLESLREYYKIYKPKYWLFESSDGKQFPKRTFQKAFQNVVKKSGINKEVTLTILKNSFAVHLLESGVDIRFVQEILGHKSSKTTMRYLKVSKRDLNTILSPLDNLDI